MKLFGFLICFVFVIGIASTEVITPAPTTTQFYYPAHHEFEPNQCHAYPTLELVICSSFTVPLNVTHLSALKSLIIHNYQQKVVTTDKAVPPIQLDHLAIYFENSKSESKQISAELLHLPTKSIKILSNQTLESLDMSQLSTKLNSIFITQVSKLTNFDFAKFTSLTSIHLREIGFEPAISSLTFQNSPLTYVELSKTNLAGKFMFTPKSCPQNGSKIHIILHENAQLTDFDLRALFANPKASNCHYHIDLSDNPKLRPDLLTSQLAILEQKIDFLDIQLRNVPKLQCDCKLYDLYSKVLVGRLHNVLCWKDGKEIGYLDFVQRQNVC